MLYLFLWNQQKGNCILHHNFKLSYHRKFILTSVWMLFFSVGAVFASCCIFDLPQFLCAGNGLHSSAAHVLCSVLLPILILFLIGNERWPICLPVLGYFSFCLGFSACLFFHSFYSGGFLLFLLHCFPFLAANGICLYFSLSDLTRSGELSRRTAAVVLILMFIAFDHYCIGPFLTDVYSLL